MLLSQAIASAATVGIGCGAGCGSSASAFLTTYILSEGKNMRYALFQVAAFYIGKMLAVVTVCMTGALLGQAFIGENGELAGFPLRKLVSMVMVATALWLLRTWVKEHKGCKTAATVPEKAAGFHPLRWGWILSGALSVRISAQLGMYLPWFQLILYVIYFLTGLYGVVA